MPRTFLFGAKAAPGYQMAKLIIKLINGVAEVVNARPATSPAACKVVFLPNFNVSLAERIYPGGRPLGADLAWPARRPRAPAT